MKTKNAARDSIGFINSPYFIYLVNALWLTPIALAFAGVSTRDLICWVQRAVLVGAFAYAVFKSLKRPSFPVTIFTLLAVIADAACFTMHCQAVRILNPANHELSGFSFAIANLATSILMTSGIAWIARMQEMTLSRPTPRFQSAAENNDGLPNMIPGVNAGQPEITL